MKSVMDRFLTYVSYDTKSNPDSLTTPSTESQLVFGDILVQELKELGLTDIEKDENGGESDGNIDSNNRESNINSDNDESREKIDSKAMENSTDEKEDKPKFVSLDNF